MDSRRQVVGYFSSGISCVALPTISTVFPRSFRDSHASKILTVNICEIRVVKSSQFNKEDGYPLPRTYCTYARYYALHFTDEELRLSQI